MKSKITKDMIGRGLFGDNFWSKVNKTDSCWLWIGGRNRGGYGLFSIGKSRDRDHVTYRVHRVSWVIHNSEIPDGLCVLHNCPGGDNPLCLNPAHLFLGTNKNNSDDMVKKNRQAKGEKVGNSVLTEKKVIQIWEYDREDLTPRNIAKKLGVSSTAVFDVLSGKYWSHCKPDFADTTKNRVRLGSRRRTAKLNEDQVRKIRERLKIENCSAIAKDIKVSPTCIQDIASGKNWKHVV